MAAEQIRRALLAQTGITCWFPRWSLPGAAASHAECLDSAIPDDAESIAQAAVVEVPLSTPAPVNRAAALLGASELKTAESMAAPATSPVVAPVPVTQVPVVQEPVTPVPVISASKAETTAALDIPEPFAFSWFALDRRLAVLCMLPPGASRVSGSCRQMLARLLAALHPSLQSVALNEQSFHWPFIDAPDLPADVAASRQAVDAFVARRLREQNAAMVLVLSDEFPWFLATGALEKDADSAMATGTLTVHSRFGFAMLVTHSLHAMEQNAGLKRDAWQALQLLRERLARNGGDTNAGNRNAADRNAGE